MRSSITTGRFGFLGAAWRLAYPYWRSEHKWSAIGLITAVIALNLFSVWLNVRFNTWYRNAYDALQEYEWQKFLWQLGVFTILAALSIVEGVYELYLRQIFHIRWRRWMTERLLGSWLADRVYYHLELDRSATDNPDQRIAYDIDQFASLTLSLALGLMNSVVTLISFLFILWGLSGSLEIPLWGGASVTIPGYLVFVALIYAVIGTWLTHLIGRPLAQLLFDQQRYEADFRFSMVRLRENAESVAFYRGEPHELGVFNHRFGWVVGNWWDIIRRRKKMTWFTASYQQLSVIVPFAAAAPRFFSKQIQLGGLIQVVSAFGQVQDALSFIVTSYFSIAEYKSVVDRLVGFHRRIDRIVGAQEGAQPIAIARGGEGVEVGALDLDLPNGEALQHDLSLAGAADNSVLITGPTGSGKSTLLRAIAGLWPFGRGRVRLAEGTVLFLPQKPYLPLGTLAEALAYPAETEPSRTAMAEALRTVGLAQLIEHLDEDTNWSQRLSGGEQQRLGFARVLLMRPQIVFLDEATSAVSEDGEAALYRLLREADWRPTIVSVGHHRALTRFHSQVVDLTRDKAAEAAAK